MSPSLVVGVPGKNQLAGRPVFVDSETHALTALNIFEEIGVRFDRVTGWFLCPKVYYDLLFGQSTHHSIVRLITNTIDIQDRSCPVSVGHLACFFNTDGFLTK